MTYAFFCVHTTISLFWEITRTAGCRVRRKNSILTGQLTLKKEASEGEGGHIHSPSPACPAPPGKTPTKNGMREPPFPTLMFASSGTCTHT